TGRSSGHPPSGPYPRGGQEHSGDDREQPVARALPERQLHDLEGERTVGGEPAEHSGAEEGLRNADARHVRAPGVAGPGPPEQNPERERAQEVHREGRGAARAGDLPDAEAQQRAHHSPGPDDQRSPQRRSAHQQLPGGTSSPLNSAAVQTKTSSIASESGSTRGRWSSPG